LSDGKNNRRGNESIPFLYEATMLRFWVRLQQPMR